MTLANTFPWLPTAPGIKTRILKMVCTDLGALALAYLLALDSTILTLTLCPQPPRLIFLFPGAAKPSGTAGPWPHAFLYTLKCHLPTDFTELTPTLPSAPGSLSENSSLQKLFPCLYCTFPQNLLFFLHSTHLSFKLSIHLLGVVL